MTSRLNIYLVFGTVFLLLTWLFVGLFRDDEFYELDLFTKHRPTFKMNFYSPIGMQDLKVEDLTPDRQLEEIAFQEFVIKQHLQNKSDARLWYLPLILIQLVLTFYSFGIYKSTRKPHFKMWYFPAHLAINLIMTSICLALILAFDNMLSTIILTFIITTINYGTLILMTKQKSKLLTNPQ